MTFIYTKRNVVNMNALEELSALGTEEKAVAEKSTQMVIGLLTSFTFAIAVAALFGKLPGQPYY